MCDSISTKVWDLKNSYEKLKIPIVLALSYQPNSALKIIHNKSGIYAKNDLKKILIIFYSQVRKLFEPSLYANATILGVFDTYFGPAGAYFIKLFMAVIYEFSQ